MDNLKYPKVSFLHNTADTSVLEEINSKHAWKEDGLIFEPSEVKNLNVTNLGSSTGIYMVINPYVSCPTDCKFDVGFAVSRKYQTPGRGNEYPRNHPYGRPYLVSIDENQVINNMISEPTQRLIELEILAMIKADRENGNEADFFSARKVAYVTGAVDDLIDTLDEDGNIVSTQLKDGDMLNNTLVGIPLPGGKFLIVSVYEYNYIGFADNEATVDSQGIALLGVNADIHFEVNFIKNFQQSAFYLYEVAIQNASAATKSYYYGNAGYKYFASTDNATLVTGFKDSGKLSATASVQHGTVFVTEGTEKPSHYVDLPLDNAGTAAYKLRRYKMASGKGVWSTNTWAKLDLKFIGKYRGMHGVHENRPIKDSLYGVVSYVKEVQTAALTGGASASNTQSTRVDEVVSFDAIRENAVLKALYQAIAV